MSFREITIIYTTASEDYRQLVVDDLSTRLPGKVVWLGSVPEALDEPLPYISWLGRSNIKYLKLTETAVDLLKDTPWLIFVCKASRGGDKSNRILDWVNLDLRSLVDVVTVIDHEGPLC